MVRLGCSHAVGLFRSPLDEGAIILDAPWYRTSINKDKSKSMLLALLSYGLFDSGVYGTCWLQHGILSFQQEQQFLIHEVCHNLHRPMSNAMVFLHNTGSSYILLSYCILPVETKIVNKHPLLSSFHSFHLGKIPRTCSRIVWCPWDVSHHSGWPWTGIYSQMFTEWSQILRKR